MGRPKSEDPKTEQLNIRLKLSEFEELRVLEFLSRTPAAEIVRELLTAHLTAVCKNPNFIKAAEALKDYNSFEPKIVSLHKVGA
jgi:hypothetical protein